MSKFRLPRKRKKQYQRENIVFSAHWQELWPGCREQNYKWFYYKEQVIDKAYKAIGIR